MFSATQLKTFAQQVFQSMGCNSEDAVLASEVLINADLRGIDSHGIARLAGYVRLWDKQRINPTPNIKLVHETPSTAVVDGDSGLGLVVGPHAMKVAMEKAEKVGTGWVAVRNSNHYGIAGYHSMMGLDKDLIGFAMTNASPLVAPTFSAERLLGTNPISIAIPAGKQPPFVADMATTTAANGKLEVLMRKGHDAPEGWIQDTLGNRTTDSSGVKRGGALLPLGGDRLHGSHKGYALGAIVDIFSGVLSGANFGPWVPPFVSYVEPLKEKVGEGLGHFFGAMRIDAFRPAGDFKDHMDMWIERFRQSGTIPGQERVIIPGDPEREMETKRLVEGIELTDGVEDELRELADRFKLEL